jgi:hypothetical protein
MKIPCSFCFLALILISSTSSAQSPEKDSGELASALTKVFNTEVVMDIDSTVFKTKQNNFYFSENEKVMLMTMVAPQSFEKAKEHFEKQEEKENYKTLERKKFVHNGKNVLFEKGMMKNKGEKAFMYLYAVEATEESTIFITGVLMNDNDKEFFPVIERAALSAQLGKSK